MDTEWLCVCMYIAYYLEVVVELLKVRLYICSVLLVVEPIYYEAPLRPVGFVQPTSLRNQGGTTGSSIVTACIRCTPCGPKIS